MLAGASTFMSCNKDLKDDVKSLEQQVAELKKKNEALKDRTKANGELLGTDEPITATTTFEDIDGKPRTITGSYNLKQGNMITQSMVKTGENTYDVYIERFGDIRESQGVYVYFTYNTVTKAITDVAGSHYWDSPPPYQGIIRYATNWATGCAIDITLNRLDPQTGDVSLQFSATGTSDYTQQIWNAYNYFVPIANKPVSSQFSFTGKLAVFTDQ